MGCFDLYCIICGNTHHLNFFYLFKNIDIERDSTQLNKQTKWIDNCSMLLPDNTVIHDVYEMSCNFEFSNGRFALLGDRRLTPTYEIFNEYNNYGVFVHRDCLAFIKKNYGIDLKYSDLPIDNSLSYKKYPIPVSIKYGEITKYWGQDLDYYKMLTDGNIYMALSPLVSAKNASRIKKIISQFKLKKDSRPSPSISATFYKTGDIKIGGNGKMWQISGGKWKQLNGDLKTHTITLKSSDKGFLKSMKYLNTLSQIGEVSRKPIFITSIINKRGVITVTIIELSY